MSQESWDFFVGKLKSDNNLRKRYSEFLKEVSINSIVEFAKEQGYNVEPDDIQNDQHLRSKKHKRVVAIGSIMILLIAVPLSLINHRAGSIEGARDLLNNNNLDEVIMMTTKILKRKQDPEAYFLRARAYQDKKQHERAIEDFTNAIAANNSVDYYFYSRGNAYRSIGMESTATMDFIRAIDLNPRNVNAYGNLGLSLYKQNKFNNAIKYLDKAIEIVPNHANNLRIRGDVKYAIGDTQGSVSDYNICIEIDAKTADQQSYRSGVIAHCHEARGWSYFKLKDLVLACSDWRTALKLGRGRLSDAVNQYCMGAT